MTINRPEHYFFVSLERSRQAQGLYEEGSSYALSMYVAGLAAESMFRALALRLDPSRVADASGVKRFKNHDLNEWFGASGLGDSDQAALRAKGLNEAKAEEQFLRIRAAVNEACLL